MTELLTKALQGIQLTQAEIETLLETPTGSADYYAILGAANQYSRNEFNNKAFVFAQIGIDLQSCGVDCKFCSLAKSFRGNEENSFKSIDDTVAEAKALCKEDVKDLFLMTTAAFSQETFLEYGRAVKAVIPKATKLVANIADFDLEFANRLKEAGFTGVYHICRLREGLDTNAPVEQRVKTLQAVKDANMELYYCVEPIGKEHTNEEIAIEMLRARDYPVGVMAVMKRISVKGTPLAEKGEISSARLALICAVATLAVQPKRAMGVHEPDELCLMAGANQLYAECGANPRDTVAETKNNRGFSVCDAQKMLKKMEWE